MPSSAQSQEFLAQIQSGKRRELLDKLLHESLDPAINYDLCDLIFDDIGAKNFFETVFLTQSCDQNQIQQEIMGAASRFANNRGNNLTQTEIERLNVLINLLYVENTFYNKYPNTFQKIEAAVIQGTIDLNVNALTNQPQHIIDFVDNISKFLQPGTNRFQLINLNAELIKIFVIALTATTNPSYEAVTDTLFAESIFLQIKEQAEIGGLTEFSQYLDREFIQQQTMPANFLNLVVHLAKQKHLGNPVNTTYEPKLVYDAMVNLLDFRVHLSQMQIRQAINAINLNPNDPVSATNGSDGLRPTIEASIVRERTAQHQKVMVNLIASVQTAATNRNLSKLASLLAVPTNNEVGIAFYDGVKQKLSADPNLARKTVDEIITDFLDSDAAALDQLLNHVFGGLNNFDKLAPDLQDLRLELKAEALRKKLVELAQNNHLTHLENLLNGNIQNHITDLKRFIAGPPNVDILTDDLAKNVLKQITGLNNPAGAPANPPAEFNRVFSSSDANVTPQVIADLRVHALRNFLMQMADDPALPMPQLKAALTDAGGNPLGMLSMIAALNTLANNNTTFSAQPIDKDQAWEIFKSVLAVVPPIAPNNVALITGVNVAIANPNNIQAEFQAIAEAETLRNNLSNLANNRPYNLNYLVSKLNPATAIPADDHKAHKEILAKLINIPTKDAKAILRNIFSKADVGNEVHLQTALKQVLGDNVKFAAPLTADPLIQQFQGRQADYFINITDEMEVRPALAKLISEFQSLYPAYAGPPHISFQFKPRKFSTENLRALQRKLADINDIDIIFEIIQYCYGDSQALSDSLKGEILKGAHAAGALGGPATNINTSISNYAKAVRGEARILTQFGEDYTKTLSALTPAIVPPPPAMPDMAPPPPPPSVSLTAVREQIFKDAERFNDWRSSLAIENIKFITSPRTVALYSFFIPGVIDQTNAANLTALTKLQSVERIQHILGIDIVDKLKKRGMYNNLFNIVENNPNDWQKRLSGILHMLANSSYDTNAIKSFLGFIDPQYRQLWSNFLTTPNVFTIADFEEIRGLARLQEFFGKQFVDLLRSLNLLTDAAKRVGKLPNDDWERQLREQAEIIVNAGSEPDKTKQLACLGPKEGEAAQPWHLLSLPYKSHTLANAMVLNDTPLAAARLSSALEVLRKAGMIEFASCLDVIAGRHLFEYFKTHAVQGDIEQNVLVLRRALSIADAAAVPPVAISQAIKNFLINITDTSVPTATASGTIADDMTEDHALQLREQAIYGQFLEVLKQVCGTRAATLLDNALHTEILQQLNATFAANDPLLAEKLYTQALFVKKALLSGHVPGSPVNVNNIKTALAQPAQPNHLLVINLIAVTTHDAALTAAAEALDPNHPNSQAIRREVAELTFASQIDDPMLAEYFKSFAKENGQGFLTNFIVTRINEMLAGSNAYSHGGMLSGIEFIPALPKEFQSGFFSTAWGYERSFQKWALCHVRFQELYKIKEPLLRQALLRNAYLLGYEDPNFIITVADVSDLIQHLNITPNTFNNAVTLQAALAGFSASENANFAKLVQSLAAPCYSQIMAACATDHAVIEDIKTAASELGLRNHPLIQLMIDNPLAYRNIKAPATIQSCLTNVATLLNSIDGHTKETFEQHLYTTVTGLDNFADNPLWDMNSLYPQCRNHSIFAQLTTAQFANGIQRLQSQTGDNDLTAELEAQKRLIKLHDVVINNENIKHLLETKIFTNKNVNELENFNNHLLGKLIASATNNLKRYQDLVEDREAMLQTLRNALPLIVNAADWDTLNSYIRKIDKQLTVYKVSKGIEERNLKDITDISERIKKKIADCRIKLSLNTKELMLIKADYQGWFESRDADGRKELHPIVQFNKEIQEELGSNDNNLVIRTSSASSFNKRAVRRLNKDEHVDLKRPDDKSEDVALVFSYYCGRDPKPDAKCIKIMYQEGRFTVFEYPMGTKGLFSNQPDDVTADAAEYLASLYTIAAGSNPYQITVPDDIHDKFMAQLICERIYADAIEKRMDELGGIDMSVASGRLLTGLKSKPRYLDLKLPLIKKPEVAKGLKDEDLKKRGWELYLAKAAKSQLNNQRVEHELSTQNNETARLENEITRYTRN